MYFMELYIENCTGDPKQAIDRSDNNRFEKCLIVFSYRRPILEIFLE